MIFPPSVLSWSLSIAAAHIVLGRVAHVYLAVLCFLVMRPQALLWRWRDTPGPRPSQLVRPSLRLVSFLCSRWFCGARFAPTFIFLHLPTFLGVSCSTRFPSSRASLREPSLSLLPPRLHEFMHHHLLPPTPPLPPRQFDCAWTSGCVVWLSWRFVCLEWMSVCSGPEEASTKVQGVSERASHRSWFCLALCCSCWFASSCCLGGARSGISAGQGRDAGGCMTARGRS